MERERQTVPLVRRIIGVDPGLASSGWGVVEYSGGKLRYIAHGCITTKADTAREERLLFIYNSFNKILKKYKPSESAMEKLYFGKNVTSAMGVAEARGVFLLSLARESLPITELTPNAIKQGVAGVVRAEKKQVQKMVMLLLKLDEVPKPEHSADALGAAICAAHQSLTVAKKRSK